MVRLFEQIKPTIEGTGVFLKILNFTPLLEVDESPEPLNGIRRLREVLIVNGSMISHNKTRQLKCRLILFTRLTENNLSQVHLGQQRLVWLEVSKAVLIIGQVLMQNSDGSNNVSSIGSIGDYAYQNSHE